MAVATHLKSMDFLMFAQAAEGLTHVRGILVSFVAMLLGGACLFLGVYIMGSSPGIFGRVILFICWVLNALIVGTGVYASGIMLLDRARVAPSPFDLGCDRFRLDLFSKILCYRSRYIRRRIARRAGCRDHLLHL